MKSVKLRGYWCGQFSNRGGSNSFSCFGVHEINTRCTRGATLGPRCSLFSDYCILCAGYETTTFTLSICGGFYWNCSPEQMLHEPLFSPQDMFDDDEDVRGKIKKSHRKMIRTSSLTQVRTNQSSWWLRGWSCLFDFSSVFCHSAAEL